MDEIRDIPVETAAAGDKLFRAQLARVGAVPRQLKISRRRFDLEATETGKKRSPLYYVHAGYGDSKYPQEFTLTRIGFRERFKGQRLSLAALKAVFGMMFESSVPAMIIQGVNEDGRTFWPRFGAVPLFEPAGLAAEIAAIMAKNAKAFPEGSEEFARLSRVRAVAEKNPYLGFRMLAECEVKLPNRTYFRDDVFNRVCVDMDMIIIPSEPGTAAMLDERLGTMPVFPPVPRDKPRFRDICAKLADHSAVPPAPPGPRPAGAG